MKKMLISLLLMMMFLQGFSQVVIIINGTVTDIQNGQPVPGHAVMIRTDTLGGFMYYSTSYTNNAGFFCDTIFPNMGVYPSTVYVETWDCNQVLQQNIIPVNPVNSTYTTIFSICTSTNPCQANFLYTQMPNSLAVQFTDASIGGGTSRFWNFGDNTTSVLTNPLHTYAQSGWYNVSLTIGDSTSACYQTTIQQIYVSGNSGSSCTANFYYVNDSTMGNTVQFYNQSTGNIQSYFWDFGDGTSSTAFAPSHTYTQPGNYTACLTVYGTDSSCYDMTCNNVHVGNTPNCNASFYAIQDSLQPNSFHFFDQSTGDIVVYTWSFGDGTTQTVFFPQNPNVSHIYQQPGIYLVSLTISNSNNTCFDIMYDTLYVGGSQPCQAGFVYYGDSLNPGNTYQFIDQSTGNIVSWYWNFGDPASGASNTSTLQHPMHTFSAPGFYNVCLTVTGSDSTCHDTYCSTVYVAGGGGCQANFDYSLLYPAGGTVVFTDLSTGNPTNWLWSFGDGTSSSLQNPTHQFSAPGTYNVTLSIFGNNCQSTVTKPVTILDSLAYHNIYGQVFAGNFPLNSGFVMIMPSSANAPANSYFGVANLDSNGVYFFNMVPDGSYYILAVPFDSAGYLPTYYGNTINWEGATIVTLGTPANPYNINLVASGIFMPGQGSTSGQINMGDVMTAMLDKINMLLMNEQGQWIGFTKVSANGAFDFPSMAYGTYYLKPEMPGVTSDVVKVVLTPEKPHAEVIMTFNGKNILGLNEPSGSFNNFKIYPNPVKELANLSIELSSNSVVTIELSDLTGSILFREEMTLQRGKNHIEIPSGFLATGVYLLKVTSDTGDSFVTKVIKGR